MLQRLLQTYVAGDELEVRYYLDPRADRPAGCHAQKHPQGFRSVVEKIIANLTSVVRTKFIDLQVEQTRKRITFAGDARSESWVTKVRKCESWIEPNDFGGLRVALARETEIPAHKMDRVDRIAAKYRFSVSLDPDWRLDISAVKCATLDTIQSVKTKLLACDDPFVLWGWWDHWEFEIEYINTDFEPTIDIQDLYQHYSLLAPDINFDMLNTVRSIALLIQHPKVATFQKISPRNTISRLLPKAVEPTLDQWIEEYVYGVDTMILRDKIDGTRELVCLRDNQLICVNANSLEIWDEPTIADTYVFDAEFYDDTWYILHVLVWKCRVVTHLADSERLALLKDLPEIAGLEVCPWIKLTQASTQIPEWWARKTVYRRDGLLLATDDAYWTQRCLKWKPADESTQDMLIVQCPDWLEGKAPFVKNSDTDTLYLLNVGVNASIVVKQHGFPLKRYLDIFHLDKSAQYVPQPFAPTDNPLVYVWSSDRADLNGYIGEFLYDQKWILKRIRLDKPSLLKGGTEIGNDIRTALDIWSKQAYPFPIEYLYNPPVERKSGFESLRAPIETIIQDLIEEESATTAICHMCPFVPFTSNIPNRAALVPKDAWSEYQPAKLTITQIPYTQIGKITMPKEFIGGAQIVVTMDPELLGHVSCVGKTVASGGRLVVVCRFRGEPDADAHPLVGRISLMKDLERAGFTLLEDHGVPESDGWEITDLRFDMFDILSFRKENRGSTEMTADEVQRENPHLSQNKNANFEYKFMRQKTKDIAALTTTQAACASLEVNPMKGELLIDIEYLCTLSATAQVLYCGTQIEKLRELFPKITWLCEEADITNVESLITHGDYKTSHAMVAKYEPHSGVIDFDHTDLRDHKVLKGKCMLHPFADLTSTRVSVVFGRHRDTWNILSEIFEKEMQTFNRVYRPSAFKYSNRLKGLDNCYDCRAMTFILTKYARSQKITVEEAYTRFIKAIK